MTKANYKVYRYRWVVLAVFMLISFVIQLQWLAHAAVERPAEVFYNGQFNPDFFQYRFSRHGLYAGLYHHKYSGFVCY